MKLRDLVPPDVLEELSEVAHELKEAEARFDPKGNAFDMTTVLVTWCVREIVRMRKERER